MSQSGASLQPCVVTSKDVARVLRDVQNIQMLRHFMTPQGSSVTLFAETMGWPHLKAYRKVKAFERLGLVNFLGTVRRNGRPSHLYHCPHERFFVPETLCSVEEYLQDTFEPYEDMIRRDLARAVECAPRPVKGMVAGIFGGVAGIVPADARGIPWCDWPEAAGGTALYYGIGALHLGPVQAKALQLELMEVFGRYGGQQGAARYLYQIILTPSNVGDAPLLQEL